MSVLPTPTLHDLRKARDEFRYLINTRPSESFFQGLFSRCPYVLSESLPLKLQSTEIRPLARPGKSDPDFIIVPQSQDSINNIGIIEIKRPSTRLVTNSRKDVALLSRDVATAIAQGQLYCKRLRAELAPRFNQSLIVGNNDFVFIIAGLSDEFTRKLNSLSLYEAFKAQIPGGCQIIPYDELLKRFEQLIPPIVFTLLPVEQSPPLYDLEKIVSTANSNYPRRSTINDENMSFWSNLEDQWRAGGYIATMKSRFIDRPYWCISGTNILASESPAHIDFPIFVESFIETINLSIKYHRQLNKHNQKVGLSVNLNKCLRKYRCKNFPKPLNFVEIKVTV